jgi:hypothetical protein
MCLLEFLEYILVGVAIVIIIVSKFISHKLTDATIQRITLWALPCWLRALLVVIHRASAERVTHLLRRRDGLFVRLID